MPKKESKNILVLVPSPKSPGGIAHYYKILKPCFSFQIRYFTRGVRDQKSSFSRLIFPVVLVWDYLQFIFLLSGKRTKLLVVNTSLGITGIIRDAFFIKISQWFNIPYLVFFRGIDDKIIKKVEKKYFRLFKNTFLQANKILVLSSAFRKIILEWGFQGAIELETTLVDTALLKDFDLELELPKYSQTDSFNLLFLSRIEKQKGIYELLRAFEILEKNYPGLTLTFCGDGSELDSLKKNIPEKLIDKVFFTGAVHEKEKSNAFKKANMFVFPSYKEGMPNALLEAMAFGLPAVTAAVGGIPDFFKNGKMGYMLKTTDPVAIADSIKRLIDNPLQMKEIASYNHQFALANFSSEKVVKRLENHFREILND